MRMEKETENTEGQSAVKHRVKEEQQSRLRDPLHRWKTQEQATTEDAICQSALFL